MLRMENSLPSFLFILTHPQTTAMWVALIGKYSFTVLVEDVPDSNELFKKKYHFLNYTILNEKQLEITIIKFF